MPIKSSLLASLTTLMLLSACQSGPPQNSAPAQADACGADSLQKWVGMPLAAMDKSTFPEQTRILHPDSVATMDYRTDRLNVHVDAAGKVVRVVCG